MCEGVFILSITSKSEISGLFSLLVSCFYEFQLFIALASVVVPGILFVIVSVRLNTSCTSPCLVYSFPLLSGCNIYIYI